MSTPHILCTDLVRIFVAQGVEVQALQGLNLSVEKGELIALVGASGSGKSTLLTILSGLDTPTAGAASVGGHDLLAMSGRERIRYRRHTVGFVWQQTSRNLLPYLTGGENLEMAMAVAGTRDRAKRIDALLDLLGVGHVRDRVPATMSGGEQQRVAIAVALGNDPEVLLADEPTGELDEANSANVLEAMRGVNEELGVTTLIVTHDPGVSSHVRRTVQIRDGRTATEVLRRTQLDEHGQEEHIAEEFAVLDRVGRLQLPQDYIASLGMKDRVRLALEEDRVEVFPSSDGPPAVPSASPESGIQSADPASGAPPTDSAADREADR